MTCDEARAAFTDLYDGTLSGSPLAALSQHLDGCPACQAEWAEFRKAMRALVTLGESEPSPGFAARVMERIEAPSRWQTAIQALFFPLRMKVPLHAAALVVLLLVGTWLLQRSPEIRQAADVRVPAPTARQVVPAAPTPPVPEAKTAPQPEVSAPTGMPAPSGREARMARREAAPRPADVPPKTAPTPTIPEGALKVEESAPRKEQKGVALEAPAPASAPAPVLPARRAESVETASKLAPPPPAAPARREVKDIAPALTGAPAKEKEREAALAMRAVPAKEREAAPQAAGSAGELFSSGATAFASRDYPKAIESFRAFLAGHSTDRRIGDARFYLASAYLAVGRHAEAATEYETFLRQYPNHRQVPTALYGQGEARLLMGDQAGCQILRSALSQHPQAREAAAARDLLAARCR
jgi:TolA-binding protein